MKGGERKLSPYVCDNCGVEYFRFPSQVRGLTKTCSKTCRNILNQRTNKFFGVNNPNYKHGKHISPNYCNCGAVKDYRSINCAKCTNRSLPIQVEYRKTDQEVINKVPLFNSIAEIAKDLSTSRGRVSKIVKENNIDIPHFKPCKSRPTPLEKVFRLRTSGGRSNLPRKLILKNNLIPYKCQKCGIGNEWDNDPLVLELDHINGNRLDDRLLNLRFLCPNCHSQTSTYKGRNIQRTLNE
jgi:predicted RNA-binding Zn-ribbon protein involved in translation (DUF1610 family)